MQPNNRGPWRLLLAAQTGEISETGPNETKISERPGISNASLGELSYMTILALAGTKNFRHEEMPDESTSALLANALLSHQSALVEFLKADLDLTSTILDLVQHQYKAGPGHAAVAVAKIATALEVIRRLAARVDDANAADEIRGRADTLEVTLSLLR
jgi:hypothetical protein